MSNLLVSQLNLTPKRKTSQLTIEQKKEICGFRIKHPNAKFDELRVRFSARFCCTISRTTLYDIFTRKDNILAIDEGSNNKIRMRTAKYPELEEALCLWFTETRKLHAFLDDDILT